VSALVPLLQAQGAHVSGCDAQESATTRRLRAAGVPVAIGHDAAHGVGVDVIVHTAAVDPAHPELEAARAAGAVVLGRGACLIELMRGIRTLAVSGSHGKTTTSWFAGHLLTQAGADPLVMVGGAIAALGGGGARAGHGGIFVAEVDESDGSFAGVSPYVAIVTNLDREHLRHYGSFAGLETAFHTWLAGLPADGLAVVPATGIAAQVLAGVRARVLTVSLDHGDCHAAELELGSESSRCRVLLHGEDLGELIVPIPGAHMVANALMAVAACRFLDARVQLADLASCERVGRRFRVHGNPAGVRVVEDYGHHPAEVRATIAAARLAGGRVHVLFQPHRYTRTFDCFAEFVTAFDQAHSLAMLPVYAAGETPISGADAVSLVQAIATRRGSEESSTVLASADRVAAMQFVAAAAQAGDTILVLGAGDVGACAQELLHFFHPGRHEPALAVSDHVLV
jgi:UDP-N-acetylmuramate--alanine ligase